MVPPNDRAEFERKLAKYRDSVPDTDADDTSRIQAVMADSKAPTATKGIVGVLAAFPAQQRLAAFVILAALILGLVALGVGKALGLL